MPKYSDVAVSTLLSSMGKEPNESNFNTIFQKNSPVLGEISDSKKNTPIRRESTQSIDKIEASFSHDTKYEDSTPISHTISDNMLFPEDTLIPLPVVREEHDKSAEDNIATATALDPSTAIIASETKKTNELTLDTEKVLEKLHAHIENGNHNNTSTTNNSNNTSRNGTATDNQNPSGMSSPQRRRSTATSRSCSSKSRSVIENNESEALLRFQVILLLICVT